jgi:amino acid transporter
MSATDILVVAFGAMIGWGWVVSSGRWIQNAGVIGTALGFIIGGIMIYFVGMTYAELTPAMPKVGGEHVFSHKAFGPIGSFVCTWALILSYIGVVCFEAVSLPTIMQYIFPSFAKGYMYTIAGSDVYASGIILASIFTIGIIVINILGIKAASILQTILTLTIAGVGIILVVASAINGSADNLNGQVIIGEGFGSVKNVLSVAVVAPFFLFGFDVIPQVAEEIFKKR